MLRRISSFERLADLDPVALERRFDDEGDRSPGQDAVNLLQLAPNPAEGAPEDGTGTRRLRRWLLEAWKGMESDTVGMMVEMDQRQEGDAWRRFRGQVPEVAAELSATVFSVLLHELTVELSIT